MMALYLSHVKQSSPMHFEGIHAGDIFKLKVSALIQGQASTFVQVVMGMNAYIIFAKRLTLSAVQSGHV